MNGESKPRVHLCAHTGITNEATIGFSTMLLNIPFRVRCDLSIDVTQSIENSFANFLANPNADVFVCIPTYMDSLSFFQGCADWKAGDEFDVIWGVYVVPSLNWSESSPYPTTTRNLDIKEAQSRYVKIDPSQVRSSIPVFAVRKATGFKTLEDALRSPRMCADTEGHLGVFAKNVFAGCVGLRTSVR